MYQNISINIAENQSNTASIVKYQSIKINIAIYQSILTSITKVQNITKY